MRIDEPSTSAQPERPTIATQVAELALNSLSHDDKSYEILQCFGSLAGDVNPPKSTVGAKSVVETYKDFDLMFNEHFYKKASTTTEQISTQKIKELVEWRKELTYLPSSIELFNVESLESLMEGVSKTLTGVLSKILIDISPQKRPQEGQLSQKP